jgi:hypothetical protein
MSRKPRSHGGRALLPLPLGAGRSPHAHTLMPPAAVIGTPDPPHPRGQQRLGVGDRAPPADQERQGRAARGVPARDVGRMAPRAALGGRQDGRDRLPAAARPPAAVSRGKSRWTTACWPCCQCWPARRRPVATVRAAKATAATLAWSGQP